MYPAPSNYHRTHSVADAVAMLSEIGEGARVLAGGQSLLPILKLRFDEPTDLVDIGRIHGLDRIDDSGDEVMIGAPAFTSGVMAKYARLVSSASEGAVTG